MAATASTSAWPAPQAAAGKRASVTSPECQPASKTQNTAFGSVQSDLLEMGEVPNPPTDALLTQGFLDRAEAAAKSKTTDPYMGAPAAPGTPPGAHRFVPAGCLSRDDSASMVAEAKEEISQNCANSMEKMVYNYDKYITKRIGAAETAIHQIQQENRITDRRLDQHDKDLAELRAILEANKEAERSKECISEEGRKRPKNAWELQVSLDGLASKAAVSAALSSFFHGSVEDDQWRLGGGDNLSKTFSVIFLGGGVTGQRRAEKIFATLRNQDGSWKELCVQAPHGGYVRMYLSKDKNDQRIATEILIKKCLKVCKELYSDKGWGASRADASITIDWQPALLVEPFADKSYKIHYNAEIVVKRSIDIEKIRSAVSSSYGRRASSVQWTL